MGTAGWATVKSIYLSTERIGQRYMLNVFWHIDKSLHEIRRDIIRDIKEIDCLPEGHMQIIEHLTPDEAEKLGEALCYWAKEEKESAREILKEIPKDIIKQRWKE